MEPMLKAALKAVRIAAGTKEYKEPRLDSSSAYNVFDLFVVATGIPPERLSELLAAQLDSAYLTAWPPDVSSDTSAQGGEIR